MYDPVQYFTTFGKNYTWKFKDKDLYEQVFSKKLEDCCRWKFVDPSEVFTLETDR